MRGTTGAVVGIIVVTLGLIGLGFALAPMMTHASPDAALISLGGLAAFAVSVIVMMLWLRY